MVVLVEKSPGTSNHFFLANTETLHSKTTIAFTKISRMPPDAPWRDCCEIATLDLTGTT